MLSKTQLEARFVSLDDVPIESITLPAKISDAIEAKLAGLDGEIAQIRAQVEEESKQDEARIKSTISEESARIVASAEQEISSSAAQARRSLRHFAADLAIEQAAKQLIFTPESDQALIAEFLGDAALRTANKGGQN